MTVEEIEKKLIQGIASITGCDLADISPHSPFHELGLDSFEIRRRNMYRVGSETANGQILNASVPLDRCLEAIEAAMAADPMATDGEVL